MSEENTENKRKRGRPPKPPEPKVQVQRPIKNGPRNKFNGSFKSVEPLGTEKVFRKKRYKWNHQALINWIMGQADPAGFLGAVMSGKEIFPVYKQDSEGKVEHVGKVSADPELRVMAANGIDESHRDEFVRNAVNFDDDDNSEPEHDVANNNNNDDDSEHEQEVANNNNHNDSEPDQDDPRIRT